MASNIVTAPLVLVTDEAGATHYVYRGAPLPKFVSADRIKGLVADGFVSEGEVTGETVSTTTAGNAASTEPTTDEGYDSKTVADLKSEIASRNENREDADKLPTTGSKADLIAALESDDTK